MFANASPIARILKPLMLHSLTILVGSMICAPTGNAQVAVPAEGLQLWLKADTGVRLNGNRVSRWLNQAGSGSDAVQRSVTSQPFLVTNVVNGNPAVRFDGMSDYMTFALPLNGLQGVTLFIAGSAAADVNGGGSGAYRAPLYWDETGTWGQVHLSPFQKAVNFRFGTGQTGNMITYTRPASIGSQWSVTAALKNGTSTSLFVNGSQVLTRTDQLPILTNISNTGNLGRGDAGTYFPGDIAEVLVYTRAVSDAERKAIEAYLMAKYVGTTPPPTNNPPTVSAGPNQTITLPAGATLNGTATDDGLPSGTLNATWSTVSGPGQVTFANANSQSTTATFTSAGSYLLRLSATDSQYTSTSDVTITVNPNAPASPVPTQNLKLWLKADAGISGPAVSQWTDQSGSGTNATQPVSSAQPLLVAGAINGKPSVRFNGTSSFMSFTLPVNGLTAMTMVMVSASAQDVSGGTWGGDHPALLWDETGGWGQVYLSPFQRSVGFRFGTGQANNLPLYSRSTSLGSSFSMTEVIKNGASESLFVNGTPVLSLTGKLSTIANTANSATLGMGHGSYFPGDLAEILVYTRALSATERQQVEQYLISKYFGGTPPAGPANQAPAVNAGQAQTITSGSTATLSGTATDDGLPSNTLTTTWTAVSGPGTVTFANASALNTTASFSAAGSYVLRLTANDGELSSRSDITITVQSSTSIPPGAIVLNPGANIQSAVNSYPTGTQFYLNAGVYRMQTITPKSGQRFTGQAGAILNGSKVLTGFAQQGSYWVVTGQTQSSTAQVGTCRSGYPMCSYPQDLFFDSKPLKRVGSQSAVVSGTWYFDMTGGIIYLADNPSGHQVELSVASNAFNGSASNVVIESLTVEKYANVAQAGAIAAPSTSGWIVQNCEVRLNHGAGIRVGNAIQVLNNYVHDNGQIGLLGNGPNMLIQGNEIARNNFAGFAYDWEAGGTKFTQSTNLTIRGNYSHDNIGPGLWTDYDNKYVLYEQNHTAHNLVAGIQHEISFDAIIRNNVVEFEGSRPEGSSLWYASGIWIENSSNVEVYGNTVTNCVNGIGGQNANRGSNSAGVPFLIKNLYVHDNTITQSSGAAGGIVKDGIFDNSIFTSWNNRWVHNTYKLGTQSAPFSWMNTSMSVSQWQAAGNDINGVWQ